MLTVEVSGSGLGLTELRSKAYRDPMSPQVTHVHLQTEPVAQPSAPPEHSQQNQVNQVYPHVLSPPAESQSPPPKGPNTSIKPWRLCPHLRKIYTSWGPQHPPRLGPELWPITWYSVQVRRSKNLRRAWVGPVSWHHACICNEGQRGAQKGPSRKPRPKTWAGTGAFAREQSLKGSHKGGWWGVHS